MIDIAKAQLVSGRMSQRGRGAKSTVVAVELKESQVWVSIVQLLATWVCHHANYLPSLPYSTFLQAKSAILFP